MYKIRYVAHHFITVLSALHAMQTRSSDDNSVCPSIRPSVERVDCDKTETKICPYFYTIRNII